MVYVYHRGAENVKCLSNTIFCQKFLPKLYSTHMLLETIARLYVDG